MGGGGGGEITMLRLNVFDQPVKNLKRANENIRKTTTD